METVIGTRTKLELISQTHGAIRVPLAQSFDYTPRYSERTIFEFDRTEAVLVVTTFDGVDIRFDYFDTDSKLVDSVLNDLDPGADVTLHDPSTLREFQVMLNMRSEVTGLIFQSVFAHGCRVRGVAAAEPVREESRITVDVAAENVRRIKGAAIQYARFLAATPGMDVYEQAVPPNSQTDIAMTMGDTVGTFANTNVAINEDGDFGLLVLLDGNELDAGAYTLTSTTITLDTALDADSVLEVWTAYEDS